MTSQRKRRSNRRNSLLSTGPRTDAGKAKSRGNAIKHGLATAVGRDPEHQAAIERLMREILADAGVLDRKDQARAIAESQIEIARVRQRRVDLFDLAAIDQFGYVPPDRKSPPPSFVERLKSGALQGILDHEHRLPFPRDPEFELRAFLRALTLLKSLERYEDRALAKRNRALWELLER